MNDLITRFVAKVKVLVLPAVGACTTQSGCFAHIIQEDHVLPLAAPLSGVVQMVNPLLQSKPELAINNPTGDGWLITIKPDHLEGELRNLFSGEEAHSWYQCKEKEILAQAVYLQKHDLHELGPTMQDGGVAVSSLDDMLKVMNPIQKTKILDFSIGGLRDSFIPVYDKIRSEFVAMIAHELRAPVAAVVQQLSVILGNTAGDLNETQKQLIVRAKERAQGVQLLIVDLLDLSKAEAGKMVQRREPLSLVEVIANAAQMIGPEAAKRNVHIECFAQPNLPLVQADRAAMESLFTNLISNAVKYNRIDGKVTVNLVNQDGCVKVVVTDTGIGIKEEDTLRIFDKFYRVTSPETRYIVGTGLGLAIVKDIVSDHRGSITVNSELGKGTSFSVLLPKAEPALSKSTSS